MMPCKLLKLKMVKMMYGACRVCAARLVVSGDGRAVLYLGLDISPVL